MCPTLELGLQCTHLRGRKGLVPGILYGAEEWNGVAHGAMCFPLQNIYKSIEIRKTVNVVGDHLGTTAPWLLLPNSSSLKATTHQFAPPPPLKPISTLGTLGGDQTLLLDGVVTPLASSPLPPPTPGDSLLRGKEGPVGPPGPGAAPAPPPPRRCRRSQCPLWRMKLSRHMNFLAQTLHS